METNPTGETPETPPAETANTDETNTASSETQETTSETAQTKTPEELQAELESLQTQLKKVNRESADRRKQLDAFEKAKQDAADAEKTELQKAQDDLAEANKKLEQTQAVARRHEVLSAVRNAGQQMKVLLNEDALSDLYDAGHFKDVEMTDDGKPQNVDAFLKVLIKSKPYVLQVQAAAAPEIGANRGGGSGTGELMSDEEFHNRAREFGIDLPPIK